MSPQQGIGEFARPLLQRMTIQSPDERWDCHHVHTLLLQYRRLYGVDGPTSQETEEYVDKACKLTRKLTDIMKVDDQPFGNLITASCISPSLPLFRALKTVNAPYKQLLSMRMFSYPQRRSILHIPMRTSFLALVSVIPGGTSFSIT